LSACREMKIFVAGNYALGVDTIMKDLETARQAEQP
jgi:hypothetical protein